MVKNIKIQKPPFYSCQVFHKLLFMVMLGIAHVLGKTLTRNPVRIFASNSITLSFSLLKCMFRFKIHPKFSRGLSAIIINVEVLEKLESE